MLFERISGNLGRASNGFLEEVIFNLKHERTGTFQEKTWIRIIWAMVMCVGELM